MSEWIKNTGVQPVADDVLVDVKWSYDMKTYDEDAAYWDWSLDNPDAVKYWRLSPVPAKEAEDPLVKEETFVGLEEAYNNNQVSFDLWKDAPKISDLLSKDCKISLGDVAVARKTDEQIIADILTTLNRSRYTQNVYTAEEVEAVMLVARVVKDLRGD